MTQTTDHQFKSYLPTSTFINQDPKMESSLKENKETHSFKNKTIRKRNYQRRKKRFIVHSICILDKTDPMNPKYKIETFLIHDKKPRHVQGTADVSNIIEKKDDEQLKKMLDQTKLKKNVMEMKNCLAKPSKSTNDQVQNISVENFNLWTDQTFQSSYIPLNTTNFSSNMYYPQYFGYSGWTGML